MLMVSVSIHYPLYHTRSILTHIIKYHTHTHTHMHACTHAHTHTHTHTHNTPKDNINYSTGFCNLTALEASSCTYDVPLDGGATSQKKLENHYDLAESTLSNTYEYVQGGIGTYSEVVGYTEDNHG